MNDGIDVHRGALDYFTAEHAEFQLSCFVGVHGFFSFGFCFVCRSAGAPASGTARSKIACVVTPVFQTGDTGRLESRRYWGAIHARIDRHFQSPRAARSRWRMFSFRQSSFLLADLLEVLADFASGRILSGQFESFLEGLLRF